MKNPENSIHLKAVQGKALVKRIKKECGYHEYEIEDILDALSVVAIEIMQEGKGFKLKELGTLYAHRYPDKTIKDLHTGEIKVIKPRNKAKFLISQNLLRELNPGYESSTETNKEEDNE